MSRLATLRSRLDDLRRRRQGVRFSAAWSVPIVAVLWVLLSLFVLDVLFSLTLIQRLVLLAIGGYSVYWAYRKYAAPMLAVTEDNLEMALLVERQQKIDSDLVAALQFETDGDHKWGSSQLETAVIDYVAEFSQGLNLLEGFSREELYRRAQLLVGTLAVLIGLAVFMPAHMATFLNRLAFGSAHYPTRTRIVDVKVNGKDLGAEPHRFATPQKTAYGQPLAFEIKASGDLPEKGRVSLRSIKSGLTTSVPVEKSGEAFDGIQVYSGSLPRLLDAVDYQVYLGDAWTDPARMFVVSLPTLDLHLDVVPPDYMRHRPQAAPPRGARQISVIEGSQVDVWLSSDKPLTKAVLTIANKEYSLAKGTPKSSASFADAKTAEWWTLPPGDHPLAAVRDALEFRIDVLDAETADLGAATNEELVVQGSIKIETDREPRIAADLITRAVMPAAKPKIMYGATDDYGLAKIRVQRQVIRQNEQGEKQEPQILPSIDVAIEKHPPQYEGVFTLDLAELKLAKGDQVRVILEAIDYRGTVAGKSALSDPLLLEVTDKQGVLEAMLEADKRSDRQIEAIIRRQLGIGESK